MRTDKAKNIKALKDELLKNPLQTEEEIAKKIWINRRSVNRLKDEMSEIVSNAKNEQIMSITDNDRKIIEDAQFINMFALKWIVDKIKSKEIEKLDLREAKTASEIAKESTARYTLFKWNITDENGWMKNTIKELTDDELLNIIKV